MQAAITKAWGQMVLEEIPKPEPGRGQVRVRTLLAGICGSDVHIFQGHHPTACSPIVQGHEFVGEVDAVGPDVDDHIQVGQRIVVEPLISCGTCEACRRGHVHVCRKLKLLGIHENGAFAQYFTAPAAKVIPVPDQLDNRLAVLAEPFAVGVHVCSRASLPTAGRALVIGAGPIGLIVAIVARASGAQVTISEVSDDRLALAASFGFDTVDAKTDPAQQADVATQGDGFDATFEVSGVEAGLALAIEATRVRGTIVQVGFHSKPPAAAVFQLTIKELSLVGSRVYTQEDFRRTLRLLTMLAAEEGAGLGRLICEQTNLAGIESAIQRMIQGAVPGKVIVDPTGV